MVRGWHDRVLGTVNTVKVQEYFVYLRLPQLYRLAPLRTFLTSFTFHSTVLALASFSLCCCACVGIVSCLLPQTVAHRSLVRGGCVMCIPRRRKASLDALRFWLCGWQLTPTRVDVRCLLTQV